MKHRLLEYLVEKKGFTVFAIEGNWPEAETADRYMEGGEGEAVAALATPITRPRRTCMRHREAAGQDDALNAATAVPAEWATAEDCRDLVKPRASCRRPPRCTHCRGPSERDRAMADNVRWLVEEQFPGEKIVLWAHNGHVSTAPQSGEKNQGMHLRDRYGDKIGHIGFRAASWPGAGQADGREQDQAWPASRLALSPQWRLGRGDNRCRRQCRRTPADHRVGYRTVRGKDRLALLRLDISGENLPRR